MCGLKVLLKAYTQLRNDFDLKGQGLSYFTCVAVEVLINLSKFAPLKKVGNIIVIVAGAILLLHSLLPHAHHSQLNDEQHLEEQQSASSIFDYIQLAFHFDQGENHLEEYQTSGDDISFFSPFLVAVIEWSIVIPIVEDPNRYYGPDQSDLRVRHPYSHLSFRGPPQLS